MSEVAIETPEAAAHLQAIGRLCLTWAMMNRKVTDLASVLVGSGPEVAACLFPGSENMKPRCESIKKLLVLLLPGQKNEWRDRLTTLIKEIQEPLANRRNRYIHDEWHELPGAVSRLEINARVDQSDSFAGPRIELMRWHIDTTSDINKLVKRIREVDDLLTFAVMTASDWQREGLPPRPFWL